MSIEDVGLHTRKYWKGANMQVFSEAYQKEFAQGAVSVLQIKS